MASDDEYFIPLQDQRMFGAGLKRKRVKFVSSSGSTAAAKVKSQDVEEPGSRYLSIVLGSAETKPQSTTSDAQPKPVVNDNGPSVICAICSTAIQNGDEVHAASTVHQACLPHSHPPSSVDRNRKGVQYLQSYGWNPDARQGLGATGSGILYPIKVREKNDNLGVGMKTQASTQPKQKVQKLDAKQTRLKAVTDANQSKQLRDAFYQDESVAQYLGQLRD